MEDFYNGGIPERQPHGEPQYRCGAGGLDLLTSLAPAGGVTEDKSSTSPGSEFLVSQTK